MLVQVLPEDVCGNPEKICQYKMKSQTSTEFNFIWRIELKRHNYINISYQDTKATLKASVFPLVIWFLAIQLLMTSLVNSSGFFPSSIKLKKRVKISAIRNKRKLEFGYKRKFAVEKKLIIGKDSLKHLHRNLNVAFLS